MKVFETPWLIYAIALAVVVMLAVILIVVVRYRSPERQIARALKSISYEILCDILVPDGMGGQIHLDYLALSEKGLLVLDLKDVEGAVFGSDRMDEWTVINGQRRFTFRNPLGTLYDRVAAVKSLVPDIPVLGRVVFTPRGEFPKGRPRDVVLLDALQEEFRVPGPAQDSQVFAAFFPQWEALKREVNLES